MNTRLAQAAAEPQ